MTNDRSEPGTEPATPATPPPAESRPPGYVVAVGASAGGLEALQQLFAAVPAKTGAAWVVIQHLSPDHKSMMDNLLARHTAMPVRLAQHDMPLAPNTVHLIPPGMTMRLEGERLQLAAKPLVGLSLPIDIFFASLAEQAGERALAVVLSGTGSDGSRGIEAVHAAGGTVLVQNPDQARFDGMPRSAVATGVAEFVGDVHDVAQRLQALLALPLDKTGAPLLPTGLPPALAADPLDAILERLRLSAGIDFRQYKARTVLRRIERRMQVLGCASADDYLALLDRQPDEAVRLRRELLIPVTRFFRDPDVFEHLLHDVVLPLVRQPGHEPIRVWVAACATGEEAYTLAMLFTEAFERAGRSRALKIFATDAEPLYLEQAGAALYGAGIEAEVSAERLQRFFVARGGGWQVRPELRQHVIFARHNLVADPPFTRMHLVTCRNALIYLQPAAQELALARLQYALLPQGHLLLGSSESLGVLYSHFSTVHARSKIYRLQHRERLPLLGLDAGAPLPLTLRTSRSATSAEPEDQGLQALTAAYVPPTLRVSRSRALLHLYGDAREWVGLPQGEASLDVLQLLPRDLSWVAGALLRAVFETGQAQRSDVVRRAETADGAAGASTVRLVARPLAASTADRPCDEALLSIERVVDTAPMTGGPPVAEPSSAVQGQLQALEQELAQTQRTLQATIEALETSNEELQSTNEELMASNEELQSTNEELQSVNEELYTVNSEYQQKVEILNALNADLENVAQAAAIPTLFVDERLTLLRFTAEATQLFKLREGDVGRPLDDFAHGLDYPNLFGDLRTALVDRRAIEREVRSRDGNWWLARMQPYLTAARGGSRAVVSFIDISSIKRSERLQAVLDSLVEHVAVLDHHGTITMVNAAWRRFAERQGDPDCRGSGPGVNYLKVCAQSALGPDATPHARLAHDGLSAVLQGRSGHFSLQYPCETPEQPMWFVLHAAPINDGSGGVVVSHVDVTPWVHEPGPGETERT